MDFRAQFAYNDWASDRLVEMLYRAFGEETDLRAHGDARVRAVQETTLHIIAAQATWRARWQGVERVALPDEEYPTPLALRMAFGAERARFWGDFDSQNRGVGRDRLIHYTTSRGEAFTQPLWQLWQQLLFHGAYHRGQITARLLDLGQEEALLSTDLITYFREPDGL